MTPDTIILMNGWMEKFKWWLICPENTFPIIYWPYTVFWQNSSLFAICFPVNFGCLGRLKALTPRDLDKYECTVLLDIEYPLDFSLALNLIVDWWRFPRDLPIIILATGFSKDGRPAPGLWSRLWLLINLFHLRLIVRISFPILLATTFWVSPPSSMPIASIRTSVLIIITLISWKYIVNENRSKSRNKSEFYDVFQ